MKKLAFNIPIMTTAVLMALLMNARAEAQTMQIIVAGTGNGGGGGGGGSCASGYLHCRQLTIDHTQVSSTMTNFPIVAWNGFTLGSGRIQDASQTGGKDNCYDVIFTSDSAGTTKIPWKVESCNHSTGAMVVWFLISSLSSTADTSVYVHYDNASITTAQNTGSNAPANVYDSNFKAVWSLDDGNTLSGADSSGNSSTLSTITGTVSAASGKLDGGATISSGTYAGTLAGFGTAQSAITVSGWVNVDSSYDDTSYGRPLSNTGELLYMQLDSSRRIYFLVNAGGTGIAQTASTVLTKGSWYYVACTYDGTNLDIYINGAKDDLGGANQGTGSLATFSTIQLGGNAYNGSGFIGIVDEFRVSNIARSANWIATEYNNQKASSTFLTVGSEI